MLEKYGERRGRGWGGGDYELEYISAGEMECRVNCFDVGDSRRGDGDDDDGCSGVGSYVHGLFVLLL